MAMDSGRAEHGGRLLRILGTPFGIAAGIGAMIGAGIMRAPSSMAALVPNGYVLIGLLLFGAAVITLGCNMVAEMATAMPRDGGGYVYARRAFGDVAGLAVGWTMWMSIVAGVAALCVAFADFLGGVLPMTPTDRILVAVAMQGLLFAYNYAGIREGRFATLLTSALKAIALLTFVIAAFLFVPHVAPTAHLVATTAVPLGFAGIVAAYQLIDGAYAGWDMSIAFTGENEDPARAIPRSLFGGVVATAVLYLAVIAVMLATLGAKGLAATPSPFARIA
ncbi:MAG: APC family permease, partial [Alphaproteobacteria bacterium]|nr:APC family permease [Alphaproteobacteria bacterium]